MPSFSASGSSYKKALLSFTLSETGHARTLCHITENLKLQLHHCDNLKSHICNSTGALSVTFSILQYEISLPFVCSFGDGQSPYIQCLTAHLFYLLDAERRNHIIVYVSY